MVSTCKKKSTLLTHEDLSYRSPGQDKDTLSIGRTDCIVHGNHACVGKSHKTNTVEANITFVDICCLPLSPADWRQDVLPHTHTVEALIGGTGGLPDQQAAPSRR